jgi:MDMPI C-terminal domain
MRLNEHAFHTWDIASALDKDAQLSDEEAALVVDNLGRIIGFSGRPNGQERTIAIHTTNPERDFALLLSADGVELRTGEPGQPDLELPAEAFARLVYGRLDAAHTPAFTGDAALLDSLRAVFPGF